MEAAIRTIRDHRERVRGGQQIEIGMNAPWLYVGKPPFDVGPGTRSGSAEEIAAALRGIKNLGVSHCGVRFRSRSAAEMIEQIERFGREVAPLVNT